jgi:8-oxo-dGTP pyrophosphatase MutT (NUDIX family)
MNKYKFVGYNSTVIVCLATNKKDAVKTIAKLIAIYLHKYSIFLQSKEGIRHIIDNTVVVRRHTKLTITLVDIRLTCGLILLNRHNELVVGRVTGSSPVRWDIPKGQIDIGDDTSCWAAAVRECYEETGINITQIPTNVTELNFVPFADEDEKRSISEVITVAKYFIVRTSEKFEDMKCISTFIADDGTRQPELDIVKVVKLSQLPNLHYTQLAAIKEIL